MDAVLVEALRALLAMWRETATDSHGHEHVYISSTLLQCALELEAVLVAVRKMAVKGKASR